jgi:hypothetical protein
MYQPSRSHVQPYELDQNSRKMINSSANFITDIYVASKMPHRPLVQIPVA